MLTHVRLFVIPWTIACQAPLSCLWVSPQEYWSRWPFPPQGIFLEGLSPSLLPLLHCQEDSLPLGPPGQPCSGLRGGPKRYAHPLLVSVTLFDKRVFADAMKSRTSGWDHPWDHLAPKSGDRCSHVGRERRRHRAEKLMWRQGQRPDESIYLPRNTRGFQKHLVARRSLGTPSPQEASKRARPGRWLDARLLASRSMWGSISVVFSH